MPGDQLPEEAYLLALASLPEIGPCQLGALVVGMGAKRAWLALRAERDVHSLAPGSPLERVLSSRRVRDPHRWLAHAQAVDVAHMWSRHLEAGLGVGARRSAVWPADAFEDLADPPALLVWKGDIDVLAGARVAIVGTRSCSRYGSEIARELGADLAAAGVSVVSGLALGIDAAAHRGALSSDGAPPVAVVASGLDVVYPERNRSLWDEVADRGLLLSEQPLGSRPLRWRFPARNRLIAALGDVTVVVESHRKGGAVITAREAAAQGRTVLSVPGPVRSAASGGCLDLLADGAQVCRGAEDVLVALGMSPGSRRKASEHRAAPSAGGQRVLEAIGWQPANLEQVVLRTGMTIGEVSVAVEDLSRLGWLAERSGWLERVSRSAGARS